VDNNLKDFQTSRINQAFTLRPVLPRIIINLKRSGNHIQMLQTVPKVCMKSLKSSTSVTLKSDRALCRVYKKLAFQGASSNAKCRIDLVQTPFAYLRHRRVQTRTRYVSIGYKCTDKCANGNTRTSKQTGRKRLSR